MTEKPHRKTAEIKETVKVRYRDAFTNEGTIMLGLAVVIGLLSGLGAVAFISLIGLIRGTMWAPWGAYTGWRLPRCGGSSPLSWYSAIAPLSQSARSPSQNVGTCNVGVAAARCSALGVVTSSCLS